MNIIEQIKTLKQEKNAVILAHYYQPPEIAAAADFIGDSLELSKKAASSDARMIVFCGVYFMAESAKILGPEKKVLIPVESAGCPMADMLKPEDIRKMKAEHPGAAVVIYVNSSAECKAESDICCTSSNAVKVAKSLPNREIIFVPDKNLGRYVASFCPDKQFYYFNGCCPIHDRTTVLNVEKAKAAYPGVPLAAHPECPPEVVAQAVYVGSTTGIIEYITKLESDTVIVGTEQGILPHIAARCPGKTLVPLAGNFICPDMKKITPADLLYCLQNETHEVTLPTETIHAAKACLSRMIAL